MTTTATPPTQDRRKLRRLPAAELAAEIRTKAGLFSVEWASVKALDFSRSGIALEARRLGVGVGDKVMLRVILKVDMGDIHVDQVEGVVQNVSKVDLTERVGVAFDYEASRHMRSEDTRSRLGRIESILERSQTVQQRLADQK